MAGSGRSRRARRAAHPPRRLDRGGRRRRRRRAAGCRHPRRRGGTGRHLRGERPHLGRGRRGRRPGPHPGRLPARRRHRDLPGLRGDRRRSGRGVPGRRLPGALRGRRPGAPGLGRRGPGVQHDDPVRGPDRGTRAAVPDEVAAATALLVNQPEPVDEPAPRVGCRRSGRRTASPGRSPDRTRCPGRSLPSPRPSCPAGPGWRWRSSRRRPPRRHRRPRPRSGRDGPAGRSAGWSGCWCRWRRPGSWC